MEIKLITVVFKDGTNGQYAGEASMDMSAVVIRGPRGETVIPRENVKTFGVIDIPEAPVATEEEEENEVEEDQG